ncbi:MAG: nucleoside hydrolase [Erysipelotrichaceae bacterium]
MKRKIIIDCDPGHDDVMAILTAHYNKDYFEILGITTVAGNQTLEKVTDNILKVQDYCNMSYPVSMGYASPILLESEPQPLAHGESGLDGFTFPAVVSKPTNLHALDFFRECLQANDEVTIVALGPLTNVAMFVKTYPHLAKKIKEVVLMGGSIDSGNILPCSEFNIYHDPHAAYILYNSDVKIVMAPIEACYSGRIYLKELAKFKKAGKLYAMVDGLMTFYSHYAVERNWDSTSIFDLLPIVYLMHPQYFQTKEMYVNIEVDGKYTRGMTVCDKTGSKINKNTTTVMISVDRDKYINELFVAIDGLNNQLS